MARFLVTGGAGFIGSNIVEYLIAKGESVCVLDNLSTGKYENIAAYANQIDFIEGDLRTPADCARAAEGVDYVLHQAALPSVPRSVADPITSHEANITGTLNMLIAARDAGVKRFVFASSSSVYGDQEAHRKDESLNMRPLSPYAVCKASGEHYVHAFHVCYGMQTVSLRYFNVFGPRQDPNSPYSAVIPLFISKMLQGHSPTIYGDGLQARDFTFVVNNVIANYLAALADYPAQGQCYNVACGHSSTLLDLVDSINQTINARLQPEHAPPRIGDIRESLADISRAEKNLGYHVSVPFTEGLKRTIDWYRTQKQS